MDEIRAFGYKPELMEERPDCLLHRLDTQHLGFVGELQKHPGV